MTDDPTRRAEIIQKMTSVPNDSAISLVRAIASFDAMAALRNPDGVIRRPCYASKSVHQDQMANSLGVPHSQQKSAGNAAGGREDGGLFDFDRLHHCHGVQHPLLEGRRTHRRNRIRQS